MAEQELTPFDLAVVRGTTKDVRSEDVPKLVAIHREHLATHAARRTAIERELQAIDRAVAMREAAIAALEARV